MLRLFNMKIFLPNKYKKQPICTKGCSFELLTELDKLYASIDATGVGGVVSNASETVAGIVEEATQTQLNAGTDTGETGAKLFAVPSKLPVYIQQSALTIDGLWHFVSAKLRLFNAAKTTFIEFTASPTSSRSQIFPNKNGTFQMDADKDISNGIVGLTLLKINFKNVLNSFTSFFTNSNTASRTYTFPDKDGTVMVSPAPRVVTAAGAVTITTADYLVVVNKTVGAATTVNLPASPTAGDTYIIKDGKGDAVTNNITIDPDGATTIDGGTTYILNENYGSITVVWNSSEWSII